MFLLFVGFMAVAAVILGIITAGLYLAWFWSVLSLRIKDRSDNAAIRSTRSAADRAGDVSILRKPYQVE
jgi:hypothetical protein